MIELTGGTVLTGILVAEAGCDLEITVKAGGHQQLLELLGCLGKSIELALVFTAGNEIVTGTFGG